MTTLDNELDRYLSIRRSLGFDLSTSARVLRRFVAFAYDEGTDHITVNLFLRWKSVFGSASAQTWSTRAGMVRQFSQWLNGIDCKNEVLPKSLLPCRQRRPPPVYLYRSGGRSDRR
jgi:integrase/recombinase XerD